MFRKLIKTKDGSHSLYVEELNEHYHSIHGALQESRHVFMEAGFKSLITGFSLREKKKTVTILEVGLGTGLNVLLTILENFQTKQDVSYTALEAFPLSNSLLSDLNYTDLLTTTTQTKENVQLIFDAIHSSEWNKEVEITQQFRLNKLHTTLQQVELTGMYDLIYFDAFGPVVQPEMWTQEVFLKLMNAMNNRGMLVTYCAKGSVKRTLKEVGFKVETLQGPPGKREMIRAVKKI